MKDIKELFNDIFGYYPNKQQLDCFIEHLKDRLSYNEKEYVKSEYGVDLFDDKELKNNIIKKMNHPVVKKEINELDTGTYLE